MLSSIIKNKWFSGGIVVVVLLGIAYYVWTAQGNTPLLSDNSVTSPGSQEILATLGQLHTIKLDESIFTDPIFASLSDFGVTIPPQNSGRRNPFAPVGQ